MALYFPISVEWQDLEVRIWFQTVEKSKCEGYTEVLIFTAWSSFPCCHLVFLLLCSLSVDILVLSLFVQIISVAHEIPCHICFSAISCSSTICFSSGSPLLWSLPPYITQVSLFIYCQTFPDSLSLLTLFLVALHVTWTDQLCDSSGPNESS